MHHNSNSMRSKLRNSMRHRLNNSTGTQPPISTVAVTYLMLAVAEEAIPVEAAEAEAMVAAGDATDRR